jgi:hypothetical protein
VNLLSDGENNNNNDDILHGHDVLCVGDMLYDAAMGDAVLTLCQRFIALEQSAGRQDRVVYLGDPGRWVSTEAAGRLRELFHCCVAQYCLPSNVQKENSGFTVGHVWRHVGEGQAV